MNREQTLDKARECVTGDREKNYGDPKRNFRRIAALWSPILNREVTEAEVALCLAALKIARLVATPTHEDSWVDMAGYAALGSEVVSEQVGVGGGGGSGAMGPSPYAATLTHLPEGTR